MEQNPYLTGTPDEFIEANMGLAHSVAWKFIKAYHAREEIKLDKDDFISIACMGLVKAYRGYNPSKFIGEEKVTKFSTYAFPMITGEIIECLRDLGEVIRPGRKVFELRTKYKAAKLTGDESDEEMQAKTGMSDKELVLFANGERLKRVDSLDRPILDEEGSATVLDMLSLKSIGADENIVVKDFVSKLSPVLRQIYDLRIGEGLSQVKIAKLLGLSQVQVSRRETTLMAEAKRYGNGEDLKGEGNDLKMYPVELRNKAKELALMGKNSREIHELLKIEFPEEKLKITSVLGWATEARREEKKEKPFPVVEKQNNPSEVLKVDVEGDCAVSGKVEACEANVEVETEDDMTLEMPFVEESEKPWCFGNIEVYVQCMANCPYSAECLGGQSLAKDLVKPEPVRKPCFGKYYTHNCKTFSGCTNYLECRDMSVSKDLAEPEPEWGPEQVVTSKAIFDPNELLWESVTEIIGRIRKRKYEEADREIEDKLKEMVGGLA